MTDTNLNAQFVSILALQTRLNQYKDRLENNPSLLQQGITEGDRFILRNVDEDKIPSPVPEGIVDAAVLWAAKDIIITLETGGTEDIATVKEYKQEARDIIKKYLESHPEEAEETKMGKFSALI